MYRDVVGFDACKRHARCIRDFDTKNTDQLGDRFPERLPCSKEEPEDKVRY